MGKIMEALFCVIYMILVPILGVKIIKNSKGRKEILWYGIMCLTLIAGDAFHLVPRVLAAVNQSGDYHVSMGIGTFVTSVTMTIFYLMLYFIYSDRYKYSNKTMTATMVILTAVRVGLCFFPQNDWTGDSPVIWGIYRNIPFAVIGLIMVILYFKQRSDKDFKWMWLAIALSFAFYFPVVLWSDVSPMIGMLMLPKTCMYIWIVVMGYKFSKK